MLIGLDSNVSLNTIAILYPQDSTIFSNDQMMYIATIINSNVLDIRI